MHFKALFLTIAVALGVTGVAWFSNDFTDDPDEGLKQSTLPSGRPRSAAISGGPSSDTRPKPDSTTGTTAPSGGGALRTSSPVPQTVQCPTTSFVPPTLINPKDPRDFGAKCDGVTEDSAAFQKAMDAGDVKVLGGTCLINRTVRVRVSNRHLECTPGTVLKHTVREDSNMFEYAGLLTGGSIVNCDFEGANSPAPEHDWDAPGHYDIPVQTNGPVNNFFLAGNTFRHFFGQSMFQTEPSDSDGGSGDQIIFNTFKACPLYGSAFVGHANGYVAYNRVVGCKLGVENNHASDRTGNNIFECNRVTSETSEGAITGGVQGVKTDYSTNVVRYNIVVGAHTIIQQRHEEAGKDAQYLHNTCIDGCKIE